MLLDDAGTVRLDGEEITVCSRVETLSRLSAHADELVRLASAVEQHWEVCCLELECS